jgi:hypothetical protein
MDARIQTGIASRLDEEEAGRSGWGRCEDGLRDGRVARGVGAEVKEDGGGVGAAEFGRVLDGFEEEDGEEGVRDAVACGVPGAALRRGCGAERRAGSVSVVETADGSARRRDARLGGRAGQVQLACLLLL